MGMIQIEVEAICGEAGMFSRIQHAMITVEVQRILITVAVHNELNLWRYFIASLAERPKNLREIHSNLLQRMGEIYASLEGMDRVYQRPSGKWFF